MKKGVNMTENTQNKVTITRDMIIGDIIQAKPEAINILMMSGMGCIALSLIHI